MPWSTQEPPGGNSTVLHAGADVVLGRFRCLPDDPLWQTENVVAQGDLVVFPGTCVQLERGRERIVADRNQVVLYADGQTFRRRLVHPAGDHCVFLRLSPALVDEVSAALPGPAGWGALPIGDATYARLRLLLAELTAPDLPEPDRVEEELLAIVAAALDGPPRTPTSVSEAWADAADAVRLVLDGRPSTERFSLAATAYEVGYSPFHLARVFRAATGSSMHAYAERLRLRQALDRVADGERDLSALAAELGFASHSHFTLRFRRAFGRPPSVLRAAGMLSGFDLRS
ncbi:MAG TPA: helix-turn-helix transcriptional regulator [Mycobacteriales bacterium]|nr:helix-turn-helix transcriptional regulator [Mycobacteriales bacterium]